VVNDAKEPASVSLLTHQLHPSCQVLEHLLEALSPLPSAMLLV
jgi:hypothetical protein